MPEALANLTEVLASTPGKALVNLYWAGLDTAAHIFGPSSPIHNAEVASLWATMDALLADISTPDTLVLFTADHGHVGARAEDTLYINERWPALNATLARSPTGQTIWPNGSPRDMFLHIAPQHRSFAHDVLVRELSDIATVVSIDAALAAGLFGPLPVSDALRQRLGDVLVLPHPGHFIWWHEPGRVGNSMNGHHGGLSAEEVTTVLGVMG